MRSFHLEAVLVAAGASALLACGGLVSVTPASDASLALDASARPNGSACGLAAPKSASTAVVEDGAATDRCSAAPFAFPASQCPWHCLTRLREGQVPEVLFAEQPSTGYWLQQILVVTDSFVVATATWGPADVSGANWDTWGVVELPTADGGAPVLVDTFGKAHAFQTDSLVGADGFVYYDWSTNPLEAGTITIERLSLASFGATPAVLAVAPMSVWGLGFALDSGYLYVGGEWGIDRVLVGGGPLETVLADRGVGYESPGAFAVSGGRLYLARGGVLETIGADGRGRSALSASADEVAIGGCPASLFASSHSQIEGGSRVVRLALDATGPSELITSPADRFDFLGFDGLRLFVWETCPSPTPGVSGGSFGRYFDTATGVSGVLTDLPGYPFVAAPTGIAHDPSGTALYYLE
jgi:hypothetical protein